MTTDCEHTGPVLELVGYNPSPEQQLVQCVTCKVIGILAWHRYSTPDGIRSAFAVHWASLRPDPLPSIEDQFAAQREAEAERAIP